MTRKSDPQEEIGYQPVSTVTEILKNRELPPSGRRATFEAEFKARFGITPDEAHALREAAERKDRS